ncbi:hypothetical protein [Flavobacterium pedocola]
MKKRFILLLLPFLLTGCVCKLKVVVQVADRNKVLSEDVKLNKPNDPIKSIVAIEELVDSWEQNIDPQVIYKYITDKFNAPLSDAVKQAYAQGLSDKIDEIRVLKDSAFFHYSNNHLNRSQLYLERSNTKVKEFREALKEYGFSASNLKLMHTKNASKAVFIAETKPLIAVDLKGKKAEEIIEAGTERTRFPILGDELVSFITKDAKSDNTIWKSVFNETVSTNFIGNSDIAMILRSNPPEREMRTGDYNNNFTIKGVRMDAADASNAVINGLTQTVNFIASTQGISLGPKTTPETTSTENPLPEEPSMITNLNSEKHRLEQKQKKLAELKKMLITKIQLENIAGKRDETEIKESAKRITEFWEVLKTELNKP